MCWEDLGMVWGGRRGSALVGLGQVFRVALTYSTSTLDLCEEVISETHLHSLYISSPSLSLSRKLQALLGACRELNFPNWGQGYIVMKFLEDNSVSLRRI